tara:strand:+ start:696 stop:1145 length:450 start_codon:yes stop_codon:yes gene_type:complete
MFGFIIYHLFSLADYYISTITDGDYPSLLRDKIRNPVFIKMGVMGEVDRGGYPRKGEECRWLFNSDFCRVNNKWSAIVLFWVSILGTLLLAFTFCNDLSLLQIMTNLATKMNGINSYTFGLLFLLVAHGTLKTLYKSGKNIKNKLDKIE